MNQKPKCIFCVEEIEPEDLAEHKLECPFRPGSATNSPDTFTCRYCCESFTLEEIIPHMEKCAP